MFDAAQIQRATLLLADLRQARLTLVTAESCTGGLIAALFTEIAGASDVFDRGFVTYSNDAKTELLGVPADIILTVGAVSQQVAVAMAVGANQRGRASAEGGISIAVTGIAGPSGGSLEKPVGLVHLASTRTGRTAIHRECRFGAIGRHAIRMATVDAALDLIAANLATP